MLEQNNFLLLALAFACMVRLKGMIQQPQPLTKEISVVTLDPEHAVPVMEDDQRDQARENIPTQPLGSEIFIACFLFLFYGRRFSYGEVWNHVFYHCDTPYLWRGLSQLLALSKRSI
jgi:hypothetical protein